MGSPSSTVACLKNKVRGGTQESSFVKKEKKPKQTRILEIVHRSSTPLINVCIIHTDTKVMKGDDTYKFKT